MVAGPEMDKKYVCKHEVDPDSIEFHRKRGRVGICKKCGCKIYITTFINNPKRERLHTSKKERLRLRREKSEKSEKGKEE